VLWAQRRPGTEGTEPKHGTQADAGRSSRISPRWLRWLAVLIAIASALIALSLVTD
jgi:hypothetical protein